MYLGSVPLFWAVTSYPTTLQTTYGIVVLGGHLIPLNNTATKEEAEGHFACFYPCEAKQEVEVQGGTHPKASLSDPQAVGFRLKATSSFPSLLPHFNSKEAQWSNCLRARKLEDQGNLEKNGGKKFHMDKA